MRICLDFDGVLHDPTNRDPGFKMGKPVHGAGDAINHLLRMGHELVIHTARVQSALDMAHIYDWLDYFGFPAMKISPAKPVADVYLDDRGLRFTAWPEAMAELQQIDFSR